MTAFNSKLRNIVMELIAHLPFSIFGVMGAILLMGFITYIIDSLGGEVQNIQSHHVSVELSLFHVFHAMHVLISSVVTTAMFWKHDTRNVLKAIVIGVVGSVGICILSDILIPYIGGIFLGTEMNFHICLIEEVNLVWPFVIIGVLSGFAVNKAFERSTEYSHSLHVFISSIASMLYLIGFGINDWMSMITGVFFVTLIAVVLPCCLSDIVFPMVCTHKYCSKEDDEILHSH